MNYEDINIPSHVAIILDGNGRWAEKRGLTRSMGHLKGYENLKSLALYVLNKGVKVLSVYAFSTENFKRTKDEVNYLMNLFIEKFKKDSSYFKKYNIRVVFSNRIEPLPKDVLDAMNYLEDITKNNTNGILNICMNYGGHAEIIDSCRKMADLYKNDKISLEDINEKTMSKYLYQDLPPIDLLIRTGNEKRISNFMLWQMSYAEFYFTDMLFPDFNGEAFDNAILD